MNFSASSSDFGIVDAPERAVEDAVAAVGKERLPVGEQPQLDLAAAASVGRQHLDHVARRDEAEARHLNGERKGTQDRRVLSRRR